jgi:hypothetical protein
MTFKNCISYHSNYTIDERSVIIEEPDGGIKTDNEAYLKPSNITIATNDDGAHYLRNGINKKKWIPDQLHNFHEFFEHNYHVSNNKGIT